MIEIRTAQNVVIAYEPVSLRDRIFAYALDFLILCAATLLISAIGALIGSGNKDWGNWTFMFGILPVLLFYTPLCEIIWGGKTVGKAALRLKVIKLNGRKPEVGDYLIRGVFRMLDIYMSGGALASILILTTDKHQRLGDYLSNTVVIKDDSNVHVTVKEFVNMRSKDDHKPIYPQAAALTEETAILIKVVLDRYQTYPNDASRQLIKELFLRIVSELKIEPLQYASSEQVLKQVLRDYVAMTR